MKLSLRKARKLENAMKGYQFSVDGGQVSACEIEVDKNKENILSFVDKKINSFQNESLLSMEQNINLVNVRFFIRSNISNKNSESGINDLMAKKNSLMSVVEVIESLISKASELSVQDIVYLASKDRAAIAQPSYGFSHDNNMKNWKLPAVSLKSKELEELKARVFSIKADIEDIDDKLMGLNSTVTIELKDDDVDFLKELKIIR